MQPTRADFNQADLHRAFNAMLALGTLAEIKHDAQPPLARVRIGDLHTDYLPLPADIGKNYRRWRPYRQQTQCLIAAPCGDLSQAIIVAVYHSADVPAPDTDPDADVLLYEDGTRIEHKPGALSITTPCTVSVNTDVDVEIHAQGAVTHTGGGNAAKGIVQGDCICMLTGKPHPMVSATVEASQ